MPPWLASPQLRAWCGRRHDRAAASPLRNSLTNRQQFRGSFASREGGAKVARALAPRPAALSFAGFFPCRAEFSDLKRTITVSAQKNCESDQRLTGDARASAAIEGLDRTNKFSQLSLPISQTSACDVCGKPFEVVRRRGRPQRFCSDTCRTAQAKAQRSDWSRVNWASRGAAKRTIAT